MAGAKRVAVQPEPPADEQLDEAEQVDNLSGQIGEAEDPFLAELAKSLGYKEAEEWTKDHGPERPRDPAARLTVREFLADAPRHLAALKEQGERAAQAAAAAIEDERRRIRDEATRTIRDSDDREERVTAAERLANNAGPPPETQAWLARNPWFQTDPDAQALVRSTVDRMAAQGATIGAQLEEAEKKVRQRFPEYFATGTEQRLSDVRRQALNPPQVQQGSRAATNGAPKEKGWSEIPRSDRDTFNSHLLRHFMSNDQTQEQAQARYARSYWASGRDRDPSPESAATSPILMKLRKSNVWAKRRGTTPCLTKPSSKPRAGSAVRSRAEAEQGERRRRQPGSLNRMVASNMGIPDRCLDLDNYHYVFANDVRGRIANLTTHDDYDPVTLEELEANAQRNRADVRAEQVAAGGGGQVTIPVERDGTKAVLLRKRRTFFNADYEENVARRQAMRESIVYEGDLEALGGGVDGVKGTGLDNETGYIPKGNTLGDAGMRRKGPIPQTDGLFEPK